MFLLFCFNLFLRDKDSTEKVLFFLINLVDLLTYVLAGVDHKS